MTDLFAPVPLRLMYALRRGEIDLDEYSIACYLAQSSYELSKTNGGIVLVRLAELEEQVGYERSRRTLLRKLSSLEAKGWIAATVEERQRTPWEIRLVGLAREGSATPTATPQLRHVSQLSDALSQSADDADPHDESVSASSELPQRRSDASTDETRLDTACSEGAVEPLAAPRPQQLDSPLETTERFLSKLKNSAPRDNRDERPGDAGFLDFLRERHRSGHITHDELLDRTRLHRQVALSLHGSLDSAGEGEAA
jgi:hypothetical protein